MTVLFVCLLPWLLSVLQTPQAIYLQALNYILIITFGLLISIFYNLEASLLRAIGDSPTPLIILAVSCLLNIFFDYEAIVYFNLSVEGAAYATVLAQALSALICLF